MILVPVNIGSDILYCDGDASADFQLAGRTRFLNNLWLPCALQQLTPDQIGVINRFREQRISSDGQFASAKYARCAMVHVLSELLAKRVIEIGCGKFPVASDIELSWYVGIDIDQVAIDHCRQLGFSVGALSDARDKVDPDKKADAVIALYAFHFAVDRDLIEFLAGSLSERGLLVFNFIVDDGVNALRTLVSLSEKFCCFRVIKSKLFASKEFFVIMGRSAESVTRGAVALAEFVTETEHAKHA
jgi:SAM-dependent methyltransferase